MRILPPIAHLMYRL